MKKRMVIIAFICFFIDQLSKFLIISNFDINASKNIIPSFFSITYIRNTGAAWGVFSNGTMLLAVFSIIFLLFAIKYIIDLKEISKLSTISYGMLLGGIIGNLVDRLFRNYVVDFLNFKIFSYNYPVFNIADIFIVIGIFLIIIESFIPNKKNSVVNNNDSK